MINQTPGAPTNYTVEAIVMAVDIQRRVCKIVDEDGRMQLNVGWCSPFGGLGRSGFNYTPIPRERVHVQYDQNGNGMIIGSTHPMGFSRTDQGYLGAVQDLSENYFWAGYNATGTVSSSTVAGTSQPVDQVPGDVTITQGGGTLGVTNTGSIVAKASSLAQIFITKIDDLVRVVSRNYQQFSEAAKKVQENVAGRVYEYKAYYFTKESSRADTPEYEEVIGDVAAGDFTKGELVDSSTLPAADERLYQRSVKEEGEVRYLETLETNGTEVSVTTDDSGNITTEYKSSEEWGVYVDDGTDTSSILTTAKDLTIEAVGTGAVARIKLESDGTLTLECNAANLTFNGPVTQTFNGAVTEVVNGAKSTTVTGPYTIVGNPTSIT